MKDYYAILGIAQGADDDAIKKAYRDLARKYHPDLNPGDPSAEDRFKDVSEAYAVLSDAEKRKQYDGMRAYGGFAGAAGPDFSGGFSFNLEDLFGAAGPQGLFEQVFGGRAPQARRGASVEAAVTVPFELAVTGGPYDVQLSALSAAGGGGARHLSVTVPPGIEDGGRLRLRGQGQPGRAGGPPGDLILVVQIAPSPRFVRQGDHVLYRLAVSIREAALGAKIRVPTVDGAVDLKIPPGTKSGQKLRLRGKGVRRPGHPGDQLVEVLIQLPPGWTGPDAEKELAGIPDYDPRAG